MASIENDNIDANPSKQIIATTTLDRSRRSRNRIDARRRRRRRRRMIKLTMTALASATVFDGSTSTVNFPPLRVFTVRIIIQLLDLL